MFRTSLFTCKIKHKIVQVYFYFLSHQTNTFKRRLKQRQNTTTRNITKTRH